MFEAADYTGKIVKLDYTELENIYKDEQGHCYKLLTDETDFSLHVPEPEQNIHPELWHAFFKEGIELDMQINVYDPVKCDKCDHEPVNGFQLVQYILLDSGNEYAHGPYNEQLLINLLTNNYPLKTATLKDGRVLPAEWHWDFLQCLDETVEFIDVDWPATLAAIID